jgi:Holliday junction resolvase RusA-like endonuclease
MISFTVPAIPIAQPRQRQAVIAGHVHNYTSAHHPVNAFKAACALAAHATYRGPPLQGPLYICLVFVFPRPKAMCWKKRPQPRAWHMIRPDAENVVKAVLDSLTKQVWHDDAQIAQLYVEKHIAAGDEQPHVEVAITSLTVGDAE